MTRLASGLERSRAAAAVIAPPAEMAAVHPRAEAGAHVDAVAPAAEAKRMTGYGTAETIDRAATPLPKAIARTHPDGIDVLVDVASDAAQFAALAGHVRPGGTALSTRCIADQETLARAGVTGVNFQLSMTVPLLDRLASRVAAGSIVPPPITRIRLNDVPALLGGRHTEGKPSSRCRPGLAPDAAPAPDATPMIPRVLARIPRSRDPGIPAISGLHDFAPAAIPGPGHCT